MGRFVYLRPDARRRPKAAEGMRLAHNIVQHTRNMPVGLNGFRAFFFDPGETKGFVRCPCGWRPDLGDHYADRDHVKFVKENGGSAIRRDVLKKYPFLRKLAEMTGEELRK